MAYQNPAFYAYHLLRDGGGPVSTSPVPNQEFFTLFDSRNEVFQWDTNFTTSGTFSVFSVMPGDALSDVVDTLIVTGHNFNGLDLALAFFPVAHPTSGTTVLNVLGVPEANGVPIIIDFAPALLPNLDVEMLLDDVTNPSGSKVPELGELWISKRLEMTRGPQPGWDHPWQRSQNRFVNDAGVSATWLRGPARKRFSLTWANVFGADRQILFDLQAQSHDWSDPFWFRPPDTDYPTLLVELDRDGLWQQDRDNPFGSGTSDRVTLPLIEVLG